MEFLLPCGLFPNFNRQINWNARLRRSEKAITNFFGKLAGDSHKNQIQFKNKKSQMKEIQNLGEVKNLKLPLIWQKQNKSK